LSSRRLDGEKRARIIEVDTHATFDFLFDISLGNLLIISARPFQLKAAKGQRLAKLTLDFLNNICDEEKFTSFYAHVLENQVRFDVEPPKLPSDTRLAQQAQRCSSCQQPI
jgi:hypothetical protein